MKVLMLLLGCLMYLNSPAQKSFVTIDEVKVAVNTIGLESRKEAQPVIVFESGLGTPMDNWDWILDGVAELAPVVAYDRAGIGDSEPTGKVPTIEYISNRLVRILDELKIPPPYILVGHSLGGLYVRGFAIHHPEKLAGLVIIDPADFTENQDNIKDHYEVLGWSDSKVDSLVQYFIDKRKKGRKDAALSVRLEGEFLEEIRDRDFEEITSHKLPNIPVHVITSGRFDYPKKYWSKEYDEEALFRSKMKHRIARWTEVVQSVEKGMLFYSGDAGHFVHIDDPELVISSIRLVLLDYGKLRNKE